MAGKHDIPAHVIRARGKEITLIDGTKATLVYGFSSIMRLEEDFGSIDAALEAIQGGKPEPELDDEGHEQPLLDDDDKPLLDDDGNPRVKLKRRTPSMSAVARIMCAGLEHESTDHGLLSDLDTLRYLLDSRELADYSEAVGEAFTLAFPQYEGEEADPTSGDVNSPGLNGGISQPSSSVAQTSSSGA